MDGFPKARVVEGPTVMDVHVAVELSLVAAPFLPLRCVMIISSVVANMVVHCMLQLIASDILWLSCVWHKQACLLMCRSVLD